MKAPPNGYLPNSGEGTFFSQGLLSVSLCSLLPPPSPPCAYGSVFLFHQTITLLGDSEGDCFKST